jgi:Uma2 family endonuclease
LQALFGLSLFGSKSMTAAVKKFGPADHGRPVSLEEFQTARWEEGYQYELIDGKLYVSPVPNLPQGFVERWIYRKLDRYSDAHPDVVNFVYNKAHVFVPDRPGVTNPEPDVAAYHDFPLHVNFGDLNWQDVSPVLVVEVLSLDDPDKDLVRNVELYLQVPSIKEYWIIDTRGDPNQPSMQVCRRRGQRWQRVIEVAAGETYTTRLLPDFTLVLDPSR